MEKSSLYPPPIPGVPINPNAGMDEVIMSAADWAALDMSDERIEQVLAEEREEIDPGV